MNDSMPPKVRTGTSLVWPLVLIGFGVIFLLNNLNIVDINVFQLIFRLWPLLLVAIGLDLLFGRRTGWWPAASVAIILLVFGAGYWLFEITDQAITYSGDYRTEEISYVAEDVEKANIDLGFGVGKLEISALEDSSALVEGNLVMADFEDYTETGSIRNNEAYYALKMETEDGVFNPTWFWNDDSEIDRVWNLKLSDALPLNLDISTGVGESIIDLRGLQIEDLDLNAGVGETRIYLSGEGQYSVSISGGVGSIRVFVPEGVAVKVRVSQGIGDVRVFGVSSFQSGGYVSDDYSTAENTINIDISGGIGEIRVEHDN